MERNMDETSNNSDDDNVDGENEYSIPPEKKRKNNVNENLNQGIIPNPNQGIISTDKSRVGLFPPDANTHRVGPSPLDRVGPSPLDTNSNREGLSPTDNREELSPTDTNSNNREGPFPPDDNLKTRRTQKPTAKYSTYKKTSTKKSKMVNNCTNTGEFMADKYTNTEDAYDGNEEELQTMNETLTDQLFDKNEEIFDLKIILSAKNAEIGTKNTKILKYENQIANQENTINKLNAEVDSMNNDMEDLRDNMKELKDRCSDAEKNELKHQNVVKELERVKSQLQEQTAVITNMKSTQKEAEDTIKSLLDRNEVVIDDVFDDHKMKIMCVMDSNQRYIRPYLNNEKFEWYFAKDIYTLNEALDYIEKNLKNLKFNFSKVVLLMGTNDINGSKGRTKISANDSTKIIKKIISTCEGNDIVLSICHIPPHKITYLNTETLIYNNNIDKIYKGEIIKFRIPETKSRLDMLSSNPKDDIHLSSSAAEIYGNLLNNIKPVIKEGISRITVPSNKVGQVLGKAKNRIENIQSKHNVKIEFPTGNTNDDVEFTIIGEHHLAANEEIKTIIESTPQNQLNRKRNSSRSEDRRNSSNDRNNSLKSPTRSNSFKSPSRDEAKTKRYDRSQNNNGNTRSRTSTSTKSSADTKNRSESFDDTYEKNK